MTATSAMPGPQLRVLVVVLQYPPDVNSTGLLMAQVAESLAEAYGHDVSVVTTFPHYANFRIRPEYRGKLAQRSRQKGIDVLRLYIYAPGRKTMVRRLASYLSFNGLAAPVVAARRSYDVILCTNGSFFTGVTASVARALHRTPFVYNVQDLYPEVAVRTGELQSPTAVGVLERIERFMYRRAAHISVIAPSFVDHVRARGIPQDKISVIPNFVDTDFIRPLPRTNEFSERHQLTRKFVVAHAGNVGHVYGLDTLLEAANMLDSDKDILFLIIGDGAAKAQLEKDARARGLVNVRFLPFQARESLPELRASCDVQVSLYKRGTAASSMPSKVYEIMASGRPLLASAESGSDVARLIDETGCGIRVDPGNAVQLSEAVLSLYRDPDLRADMGERGRLHAEKHYSKDVVAVAYNDLLLRVASNSAAGRSRARP